MSRYGILKIFALRGFTFTFVGLVVVAVVAVGLSFGLAGVGLVVAGEFEFFHAFFVFHAALCEGFLTLISTRSVGLPVGLSVGFTLDAALFFVTGSLFAGETCGSTLLESLSLVEFTDQRGES